VGVASVLQADVGMRFRSGRSRVRRRGARGLRTREPRAMLLAEAPKVALDVLQRVVAVKLRNAAALRARAPGSGALPVARTATSPPTLEVASDALVVRYPRLAERVTG